MFRCKFVRILLLLLRILQRQAIVSDRFSVNVGVGDSLAVFNCGLHVSAKVDLSIIAAAIGSCSLVLANQLPNELAVSSAIIKTSEGP